MNINEITQRQFDEFNKRSRHNEEMNLIRNQNSKLNDVANATLMLANEQINANKLQQQANEIIKLQCEELSRRNKILEEELKEAKKLCEYFNLDYHKYKSSISHVCNRKQKYFLSEYVLRYDFDDEIK